MANLNQSEIDDLFNNLVGSASPLPVKPAADKPKKKLLGMYEPVLEEDATPVVYGGNNRHYRLYDFRRPEKLSKDQARLLRAHFGLFWRRVANYLANLSRSSVDVELVEVDQTTYKEIFTSHGVPTVMAAFQLNGEYQGMLKLNLSQIFGMVDRLMGGTGICSLRPRSLTEFERNLCFEIFGHMAGFYAGICGYENYAVENIETDERLLPRKLSGDEMMVRAIYDLKIGSVTGYLNLFVPLRSLGGVLGGAVKGSAVVKSTREEDIPPVVSRLPLPVTVILGGTALPAEVVAALQPGSIIPLQQEERKPLKVLVGNELRFLARPGLVGNRMAVSIVSRSEGA